MGKDESKKDKKARRASEAAAAADTTAMSVDDTSMAVESSDKKDKKKKRKSEAAAAAAETEGMDVDGEDKDKELEIDLSTLSPIAKPLAEKKMTKKVFKTIKKASKSRGHVKRGVKEVVKGLRKGEKGLVILAGDISPLDILSHIPVLCEEQNVPYIFVPSKEALGAASSTKRPTSTVMICPDGGKAAKKKGGAEMKEDYKEDFDSIAKDVKKLGEKLIMG